MLLESRTQLWLWPTEACIGLTPASLSHLLSHHSTPYCPCGGLPKCTGSCPAHSFCTCCLLIPAWIHIKLAQMKPSEEKASLINKDYAQKTQLAAANSHFPGCLITGMSKEQVIPSVYFIFLCDNLFNIFFPLSKNCTGPLGILRIFKISGRTRVVLNSVFLVQHPICPLEMRNAQTQPPNCKVCAAGFTTGTPHRSPLSPGFRVMRPHDKHIISQIAPPPQPTPGRPNTYPYYKAAAQTSFSTTCMLSIVVAPFTC